MCGLQRCGRQEVVDAPADIPGAGIRHLRPPGVRLGPVGLERSKGIDQPSSTIGPETIAFFGREPLFADVGLRTSQVDLIVGDIQVAAKDDRLLLCESFHVVQKGTIPKLTQRDAAEIVLGVWGINRRQPEIVELGRNDPPFVVRIPVESSVQS